MVIKKTEERLRLFPLLGPVAIGTTDLYARSDHPLVLNSLDQAQNALKVSVYRDSVEDQILTRANFNHIVRVPTPHTAAQLLLRKRVTLWANANLTYRAILKEEHLPADSVKKIYTIAENRLYLAFSQTTDPIIVERWHKALIALHQSGKFDAIYQKWLPHSSIPSEIERLSIHVPQNATPVKAML